MIQIDDLPDPVPQYCTTCMEPLTWIYVHHLRRNVAVIPLRDPDRFSFRIHTCNLSNERTWRHVQRVPAELSRRGRRRVDAALAAAAEARAEQGATRG